MPSQPGHPQGLAAGGTPEGKLARVDWRQAGVHLRILRPAASHRTARLLGLLAS